jgi:hypothetical protein
MNVNAPIRNAQRLHSGNAVAAANGTPAERLLIGVLSLLIILYSYKIRVEKGNIEPHHESKYPY